jgi:hydroxymethylbilane synthase
MKSLRIGTRGSALALWQARWVASQLEAAGITASIEVIHTTGDRILDVTLAKVGTKGMFTKEIEEALLSGSIDIAVHSLKDMPAEIPPGLTLAAVPVRADARDAACGRLLDSLPQGAKVGTSSPRRSAQLRALRPDLEILDIRGNVDTRLRKLDEGRYDAILLASAGLDRLGWGDRIVERFDPSRLCPAPGQGALAIEAREGSEAAQLAARLLDDEAARRAVTAERAVLLELGAGCQAPVGAHATPRNGLLHLDAVVALPDGSRLVRWSEEGGEPATLGRNAARRMLERGADEILASAAAGS